MNKKILFLILFSAILLPATLVFAQGGGGVTIQGIVDGAVQATLYVASGIVVILWVTTGILFLTAQGDAAKVKAGRTALLAAVAGTILVIVASSAIPLVKSIFNL